jgi:superfamily I DNA and/or RNA helicase
MEKDRKLTADLVSKLIKYEIEEKYQSHREFASLTFGNAKTENVAQMSGLKKLFTPYIEIEDKTRTQKSAKYRWRTQKFREDHRDLFGDDTDLRLSKLEQMIVALKDELVSARNDVQRNSHKIDRIESVRLGVGNQAYACYLELNDDEEPNFKDGSPCIIRVKGAELGQAQIIDYDAKEQCVYLSSNSDLSRLKGPALRLVVDLTWLLQALIDKLKSSRSTESLKSGPLAGFLTGKIKQDAVRFSTTPWPGQLNASQRKAYRSALYKDVSLIWGPPGTGKSYTLAHVILSLAQVSGKTVVTCISNAALDSLIVGFLKVYRDFKKENQFATVDSNFVRLGVSRTPEVLESSIFYPADFQLTAWKERLNEIRLRLSKSIEQENKIKLKKEQNELYQRIKDHNQARINRAKVIFTTAAQFTALTVDREETENDLTNQIGVSLKNMEFDNMILDEVSMMYPPQFIGLCQNINKRIIAAGDFRQLGPIHLSATALSLRWLAQDIFAFAKIFDRSRNVRELPYLIQLLDQWRSHPKICHLINGPFYEGKLVSKASGGTPDLIDLGPYSGKPVVYINLERDSRNKVKRSSKGSRSNNFSATIVAYLAGWAAAQSEDISVGVITPYRAQVGLIKSKLHADHSPDIIRRIKVGSIHSFQGDEADVVIYDIVDAPNEKLGLLYQRETGERLVNVALSRAKRKLIVVGDIQNMHDGKGHTLLSTKLIKVTGDISRFTIRMEPELSKFINTL